MYIAIEQNCDTVNGALRSDSHEIPTNPRVHVTLHKCQSRLNLVHVFGSALTIIPVRFANDEKLSVDSVGKKAYHETE